MTAITTHLSGTWKAVTWIVITFISAVGANLALIMSALPFIEFSGKDRCFTDLEEPFRGLTSHSATGPWKVKRISKAGDVQLGRQRAPKYQSGKWTRPYLRVANVFDGYFDFEDVLSMDFNDRDFARYELRSGDILLNEGQSRELVGRCAMFADQIEGCCFQNTLIRFRCGDELIPEFAFSYFQYLFYRQTFAAVARQTTSIAHLGADTFQKLFMPVPPVDEQRKIAGVMDRFNASKRDLARQRENVQRTRQALINDLTGGAHV